jgi:hypothetical protein
VFTVEAGPGSPPRLCWQGESPLSADDLLAARAPPPPPMPARDRARDFLRRLLGSGPQTSRALWEAAKQEGLSERTLYRARSDLEVRVELVRRGDALLYYWLLRHQQLPSDLLPPGADDTDLEPWLAPLRERFPPSTPLDKL